MSRSIEPAKPENKIENNQPAAVGLDLNAVASEVLKTNPSMAEQPKKGRGRPRLNPAAPDNTGGTNQHTKPIDPTAAPVFKRSHKLLVEKTISCVERKMKSKYGADYTEPRKEEIATLVQDIDDSFSDLLYSLGISMSGWVSSLIMLCVLVGVYCYEKYLVIMELNDKLRQRKTQSNNEPTKAEQ